MNNNQDQIKKLEDLAREIRIMSLKIACQTKTHHLGSAFSIVDLLVVLYFHVLKINPQNPHDKNRDRFLLSKGHACLSLYATLAARGFFSQEKLIKNYGQDGGELGLHPNRNVSAGIEISSGSLGHGLSLGVGMALAAKIDNLSYKTYVLIGDGECNEGSIWEAAMFAGHQKLNNLVVILDYNHWQAFGRTDDVIKLDPLAAKWQAFGWHTEEINGHQIQEIINAFEKTASIIDKPSIIIANTKKGKGLKNLEDTLESHYACPDIFELDSFLKNL
jgi:transketolase